MAKARSIETPAAASTAILRFHARGLNRMDAASYVGVSATHFDTMVREGRMPQPKVAGSRVLWDRTKLDAYFAALPDRNGDPEASEDTWADFQ